MSAEAGGIIVRPVERGELLQLQQICRETFVETYSAANPPELVKTYVTRNFSLITLEAGIPRRGLGFLLRRARRRDCRVFKDKCRRGPDG